MATTERIPELITDPEKYARIEQLRKFAELMDGQFCLPGTNIQFGLDAIVGLIPGVGDLIASAFSLWLIGEARRLGAPKWILAKMYWNVAVDVGIGAVPIVGDMFDVVWKANRKNIALLSRHFCRPIDKGRN